MQISPQEFLPLAEAAGKVCTFDLETTGRGGDYNSILVSSIKPYKKRPTTFVVTIPGNDKAVVKATIDELEKYLVWVTYYGKGFDLKFLNARTLQHRLTPVERQLHMDVYFLGKTHLLMERRSQAHMLEWLRLKRKKLTLSPDVWNQAIANPSKELPTLIKRCESDCAGLEGLYDEMKHLAADLKK